MGMVAIHWSVYKINVSLVQLYMYNIILLTRVVEFIIHNLILTLFINSMVSHNITRHMATYYTESYCCPEYEGVPPNCQRKYIS